MSTSAAYRIVRQLGSGLAGPVFLAETDSGRAAVRQFQSQADPGSEEWLADLQYFLDGARQAALLHHPHIVETIEVIDEAGEAFVATEFVSAETCEALLMREQLTVEQANHMLRLMAVALDYAHQNGVVHGDLKPSNVFILPMRAIKVADFAISPRARRYSRPVPENWVHPYLSPEHLTAPVTISPRSDQYSLAALAWHLYAGAPASAVSGPSPLGTGTEAASGAVFARAMSRDPRDRFPSCLQFVDALDGSRVTATAPVVVQPKRRQGLLYAAAAAGAALLLISALLVLANRRSPVRPASSAKSVQETALATPDLAPPPPATASSRTVLEATPSRSVYKGSADIPFQKPKPIETQARSASRNVDLESEPTRTPQPQSSARSEAAALRPEPVSSPSTRNLDIVIRSRDKRIENGASFWYRDPELGELAHGDLSVTVQSSAQPPKGKLTVEWVVDNIPMGSPRACPRIS